MSLKDFHKDRQYAILIVFILAATALLLKAMQLQVLDRNFQARASATAVEKYTVYPARGLIYDRNGKLMINNEAMYDLMVTYREVNPKMDTAKFCRLLNINANEFKQNLERDWANRRYSKNIPYTFLSKIPPEIHARLQESMYEFPGFYIQLRNARAYPYKIGAQLLGYISEVNQDQIDKSKGNYVKGDYIGSSGLELQYEEDLRGKRGIQYLLKDNVGRIVGAYKNGAQDSSAISGKDLTASIDIELQKFGEELLAGKSGSIVAIEPNTGEILTMISGPSYDPNLLTINKNRGDTFLKLLQDPSKPLLDRTVMAKYPPGSIFKTIVALIGMQEGVFGPGHSMSCAGGYRNGPLFMKCHHNGFVSGVAPAIEHSCNTYFFSAFRDIVDKYGYYNAKQGYDVFAGHLADFGLGHTLKIDYPSENKGNVPTSAHFDKVYPKDRGGWRSPTIISLGIGQGELQLTTLQMANLAAIIANRGWYITPHLIQGYRDDSPFQKDFLKTIHTRVEPQWFDPVVDGMYRVVETGTAEGARIPGIEVCGKTGTVQNPQNKNKDHSVFFAFAPRDNPKIAIAAYIEYGGWGASYGAPIATLMIEKYLNGFINPSRKYLEERMKKTRLIDQPRAVQDTIDVLVNGR